MTRDDIISLSVVATTMGQRNTHRKDGFVNHRSCRRGIRRGSSSIPKSIINLVGKCDVSEAHKSNREQPEGNFGIKTHFVKRSEKILKDECVRGCSRSLKQSELTKRERERKY